MKHSKSIIHILLFITIQISQFCQAQTCITADITATPLEKGFSFLIFQNENQLELVNMHDYLLQYIVGENTGSIYSSGKMVTGPSFDIDVSNDGSDNTGTLFGDSINVSNFTVSYSATFFAKKTGYHTFSISANDAAMVSLRPSLDFFCCDNVPERGDDLVEWWMGFYENYTSIIEYTGSPADTSEVTLYLTAGKPVQMVMAYVNRAGSARFNITVTDPDDIPLTNLSDYVAGAYYEFSCNDEQEILEPASVLSSTTYSTDIITTTMNVFTVSAYFTTYYVKVPMSTIESSSLISESSTGVYSSSIESSGSSHNVVSSATESSDASTSVVESSTFSSGESSTPVSSSMASSDSLSSTIQNSATDSDITSGGVSSSSVTSSSLSGITESSMHSSDIPYSSTKSVVAHSSVISSSVSDSLSTSKMTSGTSEDSSQSSILSIESSTSVAYTYTNSSSTGSITTSSSSNIEESSVIAHTSTTEATKKTSTTVTIPCTLEECQVTSKPSTYYTSDTFVITSTVTTICPVSESSSMNFVTSTYVTKITTVVQSTYCPGGCTEAEPKYVHSANTEVSLVQETSNAQGTSHAHGTSSSSYIVELNENGVTKSSFGVVTLLISIMSLFTFI